VTARPIRTWNGRGRMRAITTSSTRRPTREPAPGAQGARRSIAQPSARLA
jgi:hypothetical protein